MSQEIETEQTATTCEQEQEIKPEVEERHYLQTKVSYHTKPLKQENFFINVMKLDQKMSVHLSLFNSLLGLMQLEEWLIQYIVLNVILKLVILIGKAHNVRVVNG